VLHMSLFCAAPNLCFHVQGDAGNYVKYGIDSQEDSLRAGALPCAEGWEQEAPESYGRFYDGDSAELLAAERGGYEYYFQALASAISHGGETPVTVE
ncbi:MAG: scyllo-inositol 2-dehydrogenase (NADP+), partial [Lentisphaeria bacterium]